MSSVVWILLLLQMGGAVQAGSPPTSVHDSALRRTRELLGWYRLWLDPRPPSSQMEESVTVVLAVTPSGTRAVSLVPQYGVWFDMKVSPTGEVGQTKVSHWDPFPDSAAALAQLYQMEKMLSPSGLKDNRFSKERPGSLEYITSSDSAVFTTVVLQVSAPHPPPFELPLSTSAQALFKAVAMEAVLYLPSCGPGRYIVPRFGGSDPEVYVLVRYDTNTCKGGLMRFSEANGNDWFVDRPFTPGEGHWAEYIPEKVLNNVLLTIQTALPQ